MCRPDWTRSWSSTGSSSNSSRRTSREGPSAQLPDHVALGPGDDHRPADRSAALADQNPRRDPAAQGQADPPVPVDLAVEQEAVLAGDLAGAGHPPHDPEAGDPGVDQLEPGVGREREGVAQEQEIPRARREPLERVQAAFRTVDTDRSEVGPREPDGPCTQGGLPLHLAPFADDRLPGAAQDVPGQPSTAQLGADPLQGLGVVARGEDHRQVGRGPLERLGQPGHHLIHGRAAVLRGRKGRRASHDFRPPGPVDRQARESIRADGDPIGPARAAIVP